MQQVAAVSMCHSTACLLLMTSVDSNAWRMGSSLAEARTNC